MSIAEPLRVLIRTKLADGRLPINSIPRMWGGPGNGESCHAEKIVTKDAFIMKGIAVTPTQAPVFHVECFHFWEEERRAIFASRITTRVNRWISPLPMASAS
jgi:hypothetical protein